MKFNALILAAGAGTRLKPLTDNCPKALVKIGQFHLLEFALKKMMSLPVTRVVVNVHHHGEQVIKFLERYNTGNLEILVSDEHDQLLDTGGAITKASSLFEPGLPIIVHNADVITTANLNELISEHINSRNLATLMVANRDASRYLLFNNEKLLRGWNNPKTGETIWSGEPLEVFSKYGFNGIHVLNYEAVHLLPKESAFPIIPEYLKLSVNHRVAGWVNWKGAWFDIGNQGKLNHANSCFQNSIPEVKEKFFDNR